MKPNNPILKYTLSFGLLFLSIRLVFMYNEFLTSIILMVLGFSVLNNKD